MLPRWIGRTAPAASLPADPRGLHGTLRPGAILGFPRSNGLTLDMKPHWLLHLKRHLRLPAEVALDRMPDLLGKVERLRTVLGAASS